MEIVTIEKQTFNILNSSLNLNIFYREMSRFVEEYIIGHMDFAGRMFQKNSKRF